MSPAVKNRTIPHSIQEMFTTLNLVMDALFRELTMGGDNAPAMVRRKSGEGTSRPHKRHLKEEETTREQAALVEEFAGVAHVDGGGSLRTLGRRDASRSASVVDSLWMLPPLTFVHPRF